MNITSILHKYRFFVLLIILLTTLFIYKNHFDNPFFFDDSHTIVQNESITTLNNWTNFFTDASTFSSLPANQSYRPLITLKNAIDYQLGNGLDPVFFHIHIFIWYLVLIVLFFFLTIRLYTSSEETNYRLSAIALFSTSWFAFHTVNAETINYICARSDSFSALCTVASLLLFMNKSLRKYGIYLIPVVLGIWTKQTGVMIVPIVIAYLLLFEDQHFIYNFKKISKSDIINFGLKISPLSVIAVGLFCINQYYLTPEVTVSTNYTVSRFEYISTQFYIILHYLGSFILPINLSADPDFTIIKPWYDFRILTGLVVILILVTIMVKTSFYKKWRPVSFGIAWFFIALLPTTLNPLFQIANDHRMFFPFIGLFIAVPWTVYLIVCNYKVSTNPIFKIVLSVLVMFILFGHAYGTMQRTEVWDSRASLWKDVSIKSPKNGRGLMNYGLTFMEKGNYKEAIRLFEEALLLEPNYYSLQINLGVAYAAIKKKQLAEKYFKSAIAIKSSSPSPEYFYARYLFRNNKIGVSKKYVQYALKKSPNHLPSKELLEKIEEKQQIASEEWQELKVNITTNYTEEELLNLSLKYYTKGLYDKVISICTILLEKYPKNSRAYNNLCSAYNQMGKWQLGANACRKALELDPDYKLAQNNLNWSLKNIN
ncbi:tetratricopeptide repeat protein [Aquimarina sp. ERC-38]|uniref:tetratricopeptide repeat protein n=1 Tax=Aquimarina sp. ERC-38 TaxID=2949996 RepID=UPI002245EF9A|nr:tetratricopeptide repeat protein [Aquimarina sp. ERC-38]UZO80725.1 tetratricopeptide repeat protein [Aquimarina sp. ERC-38]